ncbi:MAG: hypothetical protein AAGF72_05050 [Pseudomonadota bacterium]
MLSIRDIWTEFSYPFRTLGVVVTIVVLEGLLILASSAGLLGIWLTIVVLPALSRYLMMYLQSRSRDREPEVLGIEHFTWTSNFWSLFPVVPFVALAVILVPMAQGGQTTLAWIIGAVAVVLMPASLAVLSITHSPLQSLNPVAVVGLMVRCRSTYWIAPLVVLAFMFLLPMLDVFPSIVGEFLAIFMLLVAFGLIGATLRPHDIVDDVGVEPVLVAGEEVRKAISDKERTATLGHAYGFASRNNLVGAIDHLLSAIDSDREPQEAWRWYFEHMLKWENAYPALKFGQRYVSYLLSIDAGIDAMKLVMRCRLLDERFKPLPDDLAMIVALLEKTGQHDMARELRN